MGRVRVDRWVGEVGLLYLTLYPFSWEYFLHRKYRSTGTYKPVAISSGKKYQGSMVPGPGSVYLWNNGFGSRAGYPVAGEARLFYITILPGIGQSFMVYHYYSRKRVGGRTAFRIRPGFV